MISRRLAIGAALAAPFVARAQEVHRSQAATFRVATLATGLQNPWGAAVLPDGRLLVTERPGRLRVIGPDGTVSAPLAGVPDVVAQGQGGLLDVLLAPDFARSREIYLTQAAMLQGGAVTRLVRARLAPDAAALTDVTPLLDATPAQAQGRNHYGGRMAFGADGLLYLGVGDRFITPGRAQRLDDLAGKVLRLTRDGAPAPQNPFVGQPGARAEIYTLGHRNPQGMALHPATGTMFEAEFGPLGGDEINILRPGANYGWPLVTHGRNYNGTQISPDTSRPGFEDPARVWVPAISPSGIAFCTSNAIPGWRGSLFLACLNPPGLVRLAMEGDRITAEERLLWDKIRFRQVVQGADGRLLILTDEPRGRILRLDAV
ncbi:PQQ-dependent sugar dehydrogenase [Humitalea sp. 24SJ18S-53]|uniref:PQQ-dependent sugar dehydrogenase n=1 Tax=Humitalea sp. 24SJ18S-53 TaxID=3422307 RepID=UPI003D66A6FD